MNNNELPPIEITSEDMEEMAEKEKAELNTRFVIDDHGKIRKNESEDAPYIKPDHPVGDRQDQKELFTWYEFTFGRGKVRDITHEYRTKPQFQEIVKNYDDIRNRYISLIASLDADPETIQALKQEIIDFRSKHSELYE